MLQLTKKFTFGELIITPMRETVKMTLIIGNDIHDMYFSKEDWALMKLIIDDKFNEQAKLKQSNIEDDPLRFF